MLEWLRVSNSEVTKSKVLRLKSPDQPKKGLQNEVMSLNVLGSEISRSTSTSYSSYRVH
jgi:hypothetical protein